MLTVFDFRWTNTKQNSIDMFIGQSVLLLPELEVMGFISNLCVYVSWPLFPAKFKFLLFYNKNLNLAGNRGHEA